ncbi:hypothetical protein AB1Y20_010234 [Prymnesium parvum]|uniref:Uncharacterized protein n=1 Tax=Prymnesium parvum TaxID=97485 RepID=A0AB34K6K1_PRYPA
MAVAFATSICRCIRNSAGGFGVWQRWHTSRCSQFTFEQEVHRQLPFTPSTGAPRGMPPAGATPIISSISRACSCSGGGFAVPQRLQPCRCTKLMLPHDVHFQLPSTPSCGGPERPPPPPRGIPIPGMPPHICARRSEGREAEEAEGAEEKAAGRSLVSSQFRFVSLRMADHP